MFTLNVPVNTAVDLLPNNPLAYCRCLVQEVWPSMSRGGHLGSRFSNNHALLGQRLAYSCVFVVLRIARFIITYKIIEIHIKVHVRE